MKKTLILSVAAVSMMFTSCGMGGASLKTVKDSAAYAIGVDMGRVREFDSTLNIEALIAGLRDSYNKNPKMTADQARAQIEIFVQAKQAEQAIEAKVKFTKDSTENSAASVKYMADKEKEGYKKTASGLLYKMENEGTGPKSVVGDTVTVHYTLKMPNGEVSQSTKESGQPFTFANIEGQTVKGFTEGMTLFAKGGKGTIIIPFEMGYGVQGNGGVGPCQALTFEIEMINIAKPKK